MNISARKQSHIPNNVYLLYPLYLLYHLYIIYNPKKKTPTYAKIHL